MVKTSKGIVLALIAVVSASANVGAQGASQCVQDAQDGCQKALDTYKYMLPQLGLGLVGGNPVLGSSNVLGKLGRFSIGVRATGMNARLPNFDILQSDDNGPVASDIPVEEQLLPVPAADAAIGLFGGFALGVTRVGSLDALVSVLYLPKLEPDDAGAATIEVESSTRFGFGGRVGIIEESVAIPEISFAYLQRGLPKLTVLSTLQDGVKLGVQDFDVTVSSWRVMVTKNFMAFALNAGLGGDNYDSEGTVVGRATDGNVGVGQSFDVKEQVDRTSWFVGLALNLGPIKVAGEYGNAGKATMSTFNRFDPVAGAKQTYASVGLRIEL